MNNETRGRHLIFFLSIALLYSEMACGQPTSQPLRLSERDMINPVSISEELMYSTIRIEAVHKEGKMAVGTGFFLRVDMPDGSYIPLLFTNNHVLKEAKSFNLLMHTQAGGVPISKMEKVSFPNKPNLWVPHPNVKIDLCALPIGEIVNHFKSKGINLYYKPISTHQIPTDPQLKELRAIEDVVMIGYPKGLSDTTNNFPIMRRGITATHPYVDYRGQTEFVIDAACFPGSSGSPIFILNEGSYTTKTEMVLGNRFMLLGVLYAGPVYNKLGQVQIKEIPVDMEENSLPTIPINLGIVIKSKELLPIVEIFKKL